MPRLDHKAVPGIETVYSLNLGELSEQPKLDCPEPNRTIRRRMLRTAFHHRSEEHTSELQSLAYLVCRLLLEKKKKHIYSGSAGFAFERFSCTTKCRIPCKPPTVPLTTLGHGLLLAG